MKDSQGQHKFDCDKKCIGICFCTEKCVNSLNPICCGNQQLDWGGHKARVRVGCHQGGDTG